MKEMKKEVNDHADIETFIETINVNKMYELPENKNFKWAMIERSEFGYCWTMGYKGLCATVFSNDGGNNIKYWTSEDEARSDLAAKIRDNTEIEPKNNN